MRKSIVLPERAQLVRTDDRYQIRVYPGIYVPINFEQGEWLEERCEQYYKLEWERYQGTWEYKRDKVAAWFYRLKRKLKFNIRIASPR